MTAELPGWGLSIRDLPDRDRQAVDREAKTRVVKAGEIVVDQHDAATALHVVLKGMVARAKIFSDGRRQITGLLVAGDCCDLFECLAQRSDSICIAITDGVVASYPRGVVAEWIESRPAIAALLWRSARSREAILDEWLVNLGHRTATMRMAHLFCELHARLENVGLARNEAYDFPLRQHELAEILGLSTVHVNRTLQALRAEGLIALKSYRLEILDVERLKEHAMFDDRYLDWAKPSLALLSADRA